MPNHNTDATRLAMTVAVCTRNRTGLLGRALQSVRSQRCQPAEVLVVDNAPSSDATRSLLAEQFPEFRYVREPIMGLDFARNRALREASHPIVAFLDDDAVASEDWAGQLWRTFEDNPQVVLCTGHVAPLSQETPAERLFEANGGFGRGDVVVRLPEDAHKRLHGLPAPLIAWAVSVGNGTNFAVRRDAALALEGGFDEAFELGEALHGGGDLDMFWRVLMAGHTLLYQPAARVQHEHRKDMQAMSAQLASHQKAVVAFLVKSLRASRGGARRGVALFLVWRVVKPGVRILRRCVGRDPLPLPILWNIWLHCFAGLTVYPTAQRIAEQRRGHAAGDR